MASALFFSQAVFPPNLESFRVIIVRNSLIAPPALSKPNTPGRILKPPP
jgi:hypothetical protein